MIGGLALPVGRRTSRLRVPVTIVVSSVFILAVVVGAIAGPTFIHTSTSAPNPLSVGTMPSHAHLFGTDELGRDVFARLVAGTTTALTGPLIIAISGFAVSALVGVAAGYFGGALDAVTMRFVDFMFALPALLLAIVIVTVVQGGYWIAVLVLAVLNVQGDIRLVRGAALEQRNLVYVEAARVTGISRFSIMYRHIARNILPILLADFATDFAGALVALAGLAFLGLGAEPGTPDWGLMLTEGQTVLFENPFAALAPGIAIVLLAVSVNLIGDWLYERRASAIGGR
ncbi:MAG: transporter,permease [Acidimicrobiaceae bacterium]|nr:transporter,permease [Acidimicrobiaceae bacterium]